MYGPSFDKFVVVKERLEFIKKLIKFRKIFRLDIRDDMDNFMKKLKNPYREYSALRFYLALTCFDTLGQSEKYISFEEWIKTKNYKSEVSSIIQEGQKKEEDVLKIIQILQDSYNRKYSMQKSFKRFIYELLDEEDRIQLYHSIKIRKILILKDGKSKQDPLFLPSENQKLKFLISVRNYYTHKSIPTGLLYMGNDSYDEDEPDKTFYPDNIKLGYCPVRLDKRNGFYYEYSVRKWPGLLISMVEKALKKMEGVDP